MSFKTKDVVLSADRPKTLLLQKHADYLACYGLNKNDFEFYMTEYLRMSGIYWGLTAMELMDQSSRYCFMFHFNCLLLLHSVNIDKISM